MGLGSGIRDPEKTYSLSRIRIRNTVWNNGSPAAARWRWRSLACRRHGPVSRWAPRSRRIHTDISLHRTGQTSSNTVFRVFLCFQSMRVIMKQMPRIFSLSLVFSTINMWQCSGSASLWSGRGSGFDLPVPPWCGSGFLFVFNADAGPDPTFHPDADPDLDPDPSFHIKTQTLEKMLKYRGRLIFHTFWIVIYKLMWIRSGSRYRYSFVANPDFYLMRIRMRIQVTKMMRTLTCGKYLRKFNCKRRIYWYIKI